MFVPTSQKVDSLSSKSHQMCHRFTFSEIQLATQNLDESLVIGRGGFGKVYKGTITNGSNLLTAAIKRLDSTSNQGASEFWAEVNMLSNLRHCHLVSLIGYCNDGHEMILVYEYMSHGTLEDHLHSCRIPLTWMQRLKICIGSARGLDYLHTGTGIMHGVVHRDVKSSNILLRNSWAAKISDFGLSKICPKNQQSTYVNTFVKGTFGYLDPDYFYTGKLTRKSDVYAFGVVLFEVLCGKRAVDESIDEDQWALAIWAQDSIKEGRLKQIVDTNITGSVSPKCLKMFAKLAKRCLHKHPKHRPTMAEVVVSLESILALQKTATNTLQPAIERYFARMALMVVYPSNVENSELVIGGSRLNALELYFDTLGGENQTLHRFDLDTLIVATKNFSKDNKVSQLELQHLYKGKLQNGESIIVALPPPTGHEEYCMNQVSILVKLEHENLVKLLGYCIEGKMWFLVYEFAVHESLDCLVFDRKCTLLNWEKRYKIIVGVARALLYLQRDGPIQVIHCDVIPENILLDESLNPKLSNFWIARCLAINETICHVSIICGSWSYMAPEYKLNGALSTKTDVYSLGVLILEIITGHRAMMSKTSMDYKCLLLEYVESNWLEGTLSNIIDPRIDADSSFMIRFVEIGLLCVQKYACDRPSMEEVVSMLLDSSSLALTVENMRENITRERLNGTSARVDHIFSISGDDCDYDNGVDYHDYDTNAVEDFISELFPR